MMIQKINKKLIKEMVKYHKLECSLTCLQSSQNLFVHETYLCVIPIKSQVKTVLRNTIQKTLV